MMLPDDVASTILSNLNRFIEAAWKLIHPPNSSLSQLREVEVKSMAKEIPDDIAFTILSKLPLKSLKRFTCVHKSWSHLLENPHLMSMFRTNFLSKHHSQHDHTYLLLQTSDHMHHGQHTELYLLSGDQFENRAKLDWPPPLQENQRYWRIFGPCIHGTLILHNNQKIILWNPATEHFRIIPPSPLRHLPIDYKCVSFDSLRFGYDSVRDDFKVLRRVKFYPYNSGRWEIYSLRRNSWRMCGTIHMDPVGDDIYMNGVCHWLGNSPSIYTETLMLSFNFSAEFFRTTHLPLDLDDRRVPKCLVALNGSIALISEQGETKKFVIWILAELYVKESWTKLYIVGPWPRVLFPIGAATKRDVFFRKDNGDLILFDLTADTPKEEVVAKWKLHSDRIIIYQESILPIGIGRIDY